MDISKPYTKELTTVPSTCRIPKMVYSSHTMFNIFKSKNTETRLVVQFNGKDICRITAQEMPVEKNVDAKLEPQSTLKFIEPDGTIHEHPIGQMSGWIHISIRVQQNHACQIDCVIDQSKDFQPNSLSSGAGLGIRFQPFFLKGAHVNREQFRGKGLFVRGLHFSGTVTPANVILSCECDQCGKTFQIHSFHAGFSDKGYFYSDSGKYTLLVDAQTPGSPAALSSPDPDRLAILESRLPIAPDGTRFRYLNSFRCPHCNAPYIDFEKYPEQRPSEYYGNWLKNHEPISFVDGQ